jgi:hypothetical protein
MSKQSESESEYSNAFIHKCELLFQDIRENKSLKICIETLKEAQQTHRDHNHDPFEPLWFIYYMYFAIHNPKLEEYINMKHTDKDSHDIGAANILKNMIRRRTNTSTLVFQLYMYANIHKGAVTYIYPSSSILKSLATTHLKTAAVVIHKIQTKSGISGIKSIYTDYVASIASIASTASTARLSNIKYTRKDIILLALVCYMKIDEMDINTKGIFISATKEEIMTSTSASSPPASAPASPPSASPHDEKYKYLLT